MSKAAVKVAARDSEDVTMTLLCFYKKLQAASPSFMSVVEKQVHISRLYPSRFSGLLLLLLSKLEVLVHQYPTELQVYCQPQR